MNEADASPVVDGAGSPPPDAAPAPPATPETGPAEPVEPTPSAPSTAYQRRKQREAARLAAAEKRRAAREARKAGKPAAEAKPDAPADLEEPDRDDKQRRREAAMFWRFVGRVASMLAWPFGYTFERITAAEAQEDAEYLVPLAVRYRWFDVAIRWAAIPFVLVERLSSKLKAREPAKDGQKP